MSSQGFWELEGNMITIYFKRSRDVFGINLTEQEISPVLLRELLARTMEFTNGKQERKKDVFKGSMENATTTPFPPLVGLFVDHLTRE